MVTPSRQKTEKRLRLLNLQKFRGNRFAALTLVATLSLGAALFLSNRARKRHPSLSAQAGPNAAARERLKGGGGGGGGEPVRASIKDMGPQPAPRYIANMATNAGSYVVSVRQVIGTLNGQNLLGGNDTLLEQVILSVQIMALNDEAEKALKGFGERLTAEDDTKQRLETVETKAPVRFKRGLGQIFRLAAPNPKAKRLLNVTGEIVLKTGSGRSETLPFQINNVFLPLTRHYFGAAALGYLSEEDVKRFAQPQEPSGFPFLNSPEAALHKQAFPPYAPEPSPLQLPSRVMLSTLFPNEMSLHLPADRGKSAPNALNVSLRIQPENEGAIDGFIKASFKGGDAKESRFRAWDGEPALFVLPGFAPRQGKLLVLRLHLFTRLNAERGLTSDYVPPAPFPLKEGQRGALVSAQILAGRAPVPGGSLRVSIKPQDKSVKPERVTLFFDENGEWKLGNFAPGVYDFRLDFLDVRRNRIYSRMSPEDYLPYRYGFKQVKIENRVQTGVEVRPGGLVRLKPFRLMEGADRPGDAPIAAKPSQKAKPLGLSMFHLRRNNSNVTPAN